MPVSPGTYNYWIAPWVYAESAGDDPHWAAPAGTIGRLDLRADGMSGGSTVSPEGFGFFAIDPRAADPPRGLLVGDDLNTQMSNGSELATRLGIGANDLTSPTLLGSLWLIVNELADATGRARVRPLTPSNRKGVPTVELHLAGHSIVKAERFDPVKHAVSLEQARLQYAAERQRTLGTDHYKKVIGALADRYKIDYREFLGELPDEGRMRRGTAYADDFTEVSDTDLSAHTATGTGGGWSWSELNADADVIAATGRLVPQATAALARADHADFASDDQEAEIEIVTYSGSCQGGPSVRFSSSAQTYYHARQNGSGGWQLYEVSGAVFTEIGSFTQTRSAPETLKIIANGSTISAELDSGSGFSEIMSVTDTAIASGPKSGWRGRIPSNEFDNFAANDDVGGGGAPAPVRHNEMTLGVG